MVEQTASRLTDYLLDRTGDGLRTVVVITDDDYQVVYLRDDLRQKYTQDLFAEVVDAFRLEEPIFSPEIEGAPVGERRAIVHYHRNAFIIQFPFSASASILVSVSRDTGRGLFRFIDTCRDIVSG